MGDLIRIEQKKEVLTLILNRPEKRNAINLALLDELAEALGEISGRDGVRLVIVRGEGEVFSSGLDLAAFLEISQRYGQSWKGRMRSITYDFQSILNRLERLELPTIALLHGYCLGLAAELALVCDIRIAAEGCQIGFPESRLGIIPDVGGTTRLPRLIGPARAKELLFTGRQIEAETAAQWGLVNYVVPTSKLMAKADELTGEILQAAPLAIGLVKRVIDGAADLDRGLTLEGWAQSLLLDSEDFSEAVEAYMMKRPPDFKGR